MSQCTFWRSVLSGAGGQYVLQREHYCVLMHLMALILEGCWKMLHAIRLPLLHDLKLCR